MPVLVWLSKIATSPVVADLLIPSLAKALKEFFEDRADRLEESAARHQAKAASQIARDAERAEALRRASAKLSDASNRSGRS